MKWSSRYQPVDEERIIAVDQTPAECRALLEEWSERTKKREAHSQNGLAVRAGRGDLFRVYFQYDSPENRYFYYKNYFLFVWPEEGSDGGCDIHYRRVVDRWITQWSRPAGVMLIVVALLWLFIMRETTQAWVFFLTIVMVWAGIWMLIPGKALVGQGAEVTELLEKRLTEAGLTKEE